MNPIIKTIFGIGSLFVPAKAKTGTREVGVLPWSFAFMILVSGSCLVQEGQRFTECTRDFVGVIKGIVSL